MADQAQYRRLPGRWWGLGTSASLWLAPDHILSVKSRWFREEYKRFYLRDIQAVVVAPCARFSISMPMLLVVLAGLFSIAFLLSSADGAWAIGLLVMVAVWLTISIGLGCRCRLYTAVSTDDLPSLYRTFAARRFLTEIQPLIDQVQGVVDANWVAAEVSNAGPAPAAMAPNAVSPQRNAARAHTLAADLFVLSLFAGSAVGLATMHSSYTGWFQVNTALTLLQLGGAVAVLVQYSRGILGRALQRLAITALVLMGVTFYAQTLTYSFTTANGTFLMKGAGSGAPRGVLAVHEVTNGAGLLLGLIGAAILLRGAYGHDPDIIKD